MHYAKMAVQVAAARGERRRAEADPHYFEVMLSSGYDAHSTSHSAGTFLKREHAELAAKELGDLARVEPRRFDDITQWLANRR